MTAQFLATSSVRHIGVWTATHRKEHEPSATMWRHGNYRPICGGQVSKNVFYVLPREARLDPEVVGHKWVRRAEAAMRRPVCKLCLRALGDIDELLGGS